MKRLLAPVIPSAAKDPHRPDKGLSIERIAIPRFARNDRRVLLAFLVWTTPAAAQQGASCGAPGAAFGVTSYQCASCGIRQSTGARPQYVFQAEPIVLETAPGSVLEAGDVIEAVNGEPIMTQAGADRFAYPQAGTVTLTVRRGTARVQLSTSTPGCGDKPAQAEAASRPLVTIDGVAVTDMSQLKPADIDNIEVLKGEAARMLYGERDTRW